MIYGQGGSFYIGATDATTEGTWNWVDEGAEADQFWSGNSGGSTVTGAFSNWHPGEPSASGGGEDYALIREVDGLWIDISGAGSYGYVVEWDASEVLSSYTFSLTDDAGGRFAIDASTGEITVADGSLLDYESNTSHNVTVQVTDAAGNSYTESMAIVIDDELEPADVTVPGAQAVDEDAVLTFTGANAITIDSGSTAAPVVTTTLSVTSGTLTLSGTTGITFLDGTNNGEAVLTIAGTEADINAALDGMQYQGLLDFNGADTLSITTGSTAATEVNLYARYEFFNGSLEDATSNDHDGTATGDPTLTNDAERGDVMAFDGDDRIHVANGTSGLAEEITISAWINMDAGQQDSVFLSIGDEVYVVLDPTNPSYGIGGRVGGFTSYSLDSGDRVGGTGWRHVALTLDDANNELRVYLDGELTRSSNYSGMEADWPTAASQDIVIGALSDGSNAFIGSIDDVRVYDSVLTGSEIIQVMGDNGYESESVGITVNAVNDAPTYTTLPTENEAIVDNSVANASAITSGDLDADGDLDVVGVTSDGQIVVYDNDGDGGFSAATSIFNTAGFDFSSVVTADLDGDGDLDIIAANNTPDGTESGIVMMMNQLVDSGTESYTTLQMENTSFGASDIAVIDIDGDTHLDIVVTYADSGEVVLYEQDSPLVFSRSVAGTVAGARGMDVGDIDGDGSLDIAVAGSAGVVWLEKRLGNRPNLYRSHGIVFVEHRRRCNRGL